MDDLTTEYWNKLVRNLGGVVDVGKVLDKHPSILSNYKSRGYPLPSKLQLMALAKSRNFRVPKNALTIELNGRQYNVTLTATDEK